MVAITDCELLNPTKWLTLEWPILCDMNVTSVILPQVLPSILVILDIEYWLQNDINSYTQHPSFKIKYE